MVRAPGARPGGPPWRNSPPLRGTGPAGVVEKLVLPSPEEGLAPSHYHRNIRGGRKNLIPCVCVNDYHFGYYFEWYVLRGRMLRPGAQLQLIPTIFKSREELFEFIQALQEVAAVLGRPSETRVFAGDRLSGSDGAYNPLPVVFLV
jgi:hypothetical protein